MFVCFFTIVYVCHHKLYNVCVRIFVCVAIVCIHNYILLHYITVYYIIIFILFCITLHLHYIILFWIVTFSMVKLHARITVQWSFASLTSETGLWPFPFGSTNFTQRSATVLRFGRYFLWKRSCFCQPHWQCNCWSRMSTVSPKLVSF